MIENRMLVESEWRWLASPNTPIDYLSLCECEQRKAVLEHNGQRLCMTCALESGELGVEGDYE
jgi:hypothetical protein